MLLPMRRYPRAQVHRACEVVLGSPSCPPEILCKGTFPSLVWNVCPGGVGIRSTDYPGGALQSRVTLRLRLHDDVALSGRITWVSPEPGGTWSAGVRLLIEECGEVELDAFRNWVAEQPLVATA